MSEVMQSSVQAFSSAGFWSPPSTNATCSSRSFQCPKNQEVFELSHTSAVYEGFSYFLSVESEVFGEGLWSNFPGGSAAGEVPTGMPVYLVQRELRQSQLHSTGQTLKSQSLWLVWARDMVTATFKFQPSNFHWQEKSSELFPLSSIKNHPRLIAFFFIWAWFMSPKTGDASQPYSPQTLCFCRIFSLNTTPFDCSLLAFRWLGTWVDKGQIYTSPVQRTTSWINMLE